MRVTLADLGIGNIHSLGKALERQGAQVEVTARPEAWRDARVLVLPGVGSFGAGLRSVGPARAALLDKLRDGTPCLGVCLGMQLLYESSEEDPGEGLGFLPGRVVRLASTADKVPHMGWTPMARRRDDPLLDGVPDGAYVYFVHSYAAEPDAEATVATARHGQEFAAVVRRGRVVGTQFHPEKSSDVGLRIIKNFLAEAEEAAP